MPVLCFFRLSSILCWWQLWHEPLRALSCTGKQNPPSLQEFVEIFASTGDWHLTSLDCQQLYNVSDPLVIFCREAYWLSAHFGSWRPALAVQLGVIPLPTLQILHEPHILSVYDPSNCPQYSSSLLASEHLYFCSIFANCLVVGRGKHYKTSQKTQDRITLENIGVCMFCSTSLSNYFSDLSYLTMLSTSFQSQQTQSWRQNC